MIAVTFMPTTVDGQHWAFFLLLVFGSALALLAVKFGMDALLDFRATLFAMREADTHEPIRRRALEILTEFPREVRR